MYSPADPFATAMLITGHEVGWIGGEGAALAMQDGVDEVVELDGALVTPCFVDAHATGEPAAGVGLALVEGPAPDHREPGPLRASLQGRTFIRCDGPAETSNALAGVIDRPASGVLLELAGDVAAESLAALAALGAVVIVQPDGPNPPPLAALAAAGVPLAFGSRGGAGPWRQVAAAMTHPDPAQRMSARAAFAAHTRGGWRAAGEQSGGALVPGAPAHYAIWQVGDLVVQAPDERIQAWSTDPRSGTPGLPDLSPDAEMPTCLRTVVWGRQIG